MCGFCNVWACVCVWVLYCVGVCVCMGFVMCGRVCVYGFCNVWMCVCVGVLVICVRVFTVFCIVSFMYICYLLLV
jgi:hypothetical protein